MSTCSTTLHWVTGIHRVRRHGKEGPDELSSVEIAVSQCSPGKHDCGTAFVYIQTRDHELARRLTQAMRYVAEHEAELDENDPLVQADMDPEAAAIAHAEQADPEDDCQ